MNKVLLTIFLIAVGPALFAQGSKGEPPDPKTAFVRSLAAPGWGHYYVDQGNKNRGSYHIGAESVLIVSFLGFNIHSLNLRQNWYGYARLNAGVDIENRSRSFRLAVGRFNSLQEYNDYHSRARNWDLLIEDTPENRWNWQTEADRMEYNDIRNRFERIDRQLPALVGLMVVNRVVAAISAYNRAKKKGNASSAALYFQPVGSSGLLAHFRLSF